MQPALTVAAASVAGPMQEAGCPPGCSEPGSAQTGSPAAPRKEAASWSAGCGKGPAPVCVYSRSAHAQLLVSACVRTQHTTCMLAALHGAEREPPEHLLLSKPVLSTLVEPTSRMIVLVLLSCMQRTCNMFMLAQVAGSGPVRLLRRRLRLCIADQLLNVGGRDPVSLLDDRSQVSSNDRLLQLLGRLPKKLLLLKSRDLSDLSRPKLSGRGPLRALPASLMPVMLPCGASHVTPGHGLPLASPQGCDSPVHRGSTPKGSAARPAANLASARAWKSGRPTGATTSAGTNSSGDRQACQLYAALLLGSAALGFPKPLHLVLLGILCPPKHLLWVRGTQQARPGCR